jgi:transcriptional regulator with XRE-family HTH domain
LVTGQLLESKKQHLGVTMLTTSKNKNNSVPNVLRRMRESSGLTMRQAGGIIGISHVAISQFENQKLNLPDYRIEQMVKAYGFTQEEFHKIIGRAPVVNPKDDCRAMLETLDDDQLNAIRSIMAELTRKFSVSNEAASNAG